MRGRRRRFPRDPYFIDARYPSACGSPGATPECTGRIEVGDRVFHYPNTGTTLCTGCSGPASRRFSAEVADEASCAW